MTRPIITYPVLGYNYKFMTFLAYDQCFLEVINCIKNPETLEEFVLNTEKYLYEPLYLQPGKDGCDAVFMVGGNGADGDGITVQIETIETEPKKKFGQHVNGYYLRANKLYLHLDKNGIIIKL